jgi:hypothetical protein
MPQFEGGYRYPSLTGPLAIVAALLVLSTVGYAAWRGRPLTYSGLTVLTCVLFGTAFLGAAFTPVGLLPPPIGTRARLAWLIRTERGVSVKFTQWVFYLGLLLLALAAIVSALGAHCDGT